MAFHTLKFGEVCRSHPPMKDRGADPRVFLSEQQPPQPTVPRLPLPTQHQDPAAATLASKRKPKEIAGKIGAPVTTTTTASSSTGTGSAAQPILQGRPSSSSGSRPLSASGRQPPQGSSTAVAAPQRAASSAAAGAKPVPAGVASNSRGHQAPPPARTTTGAATAGSGAASAAGVVGASSSSVVKPSSRLASAGIARNAGPSSTAARPQSTSSTRSIVSVPPQEVTDATFARVDFNGNGMLSLAELDKAVIELWPEFNNKPAIMRAYRAADRNGSGFISRKEFRLFLKHLSMFNNLFAKFEMADTNGDRRLSREEFRAAAGRIEELKGVDPDVVFSELDKNNGGIILFDEFCSWFVDESILHPKKMAKKTSTSARAPKVAPRAIKFPLPSTIADAFTRVDFNGNGMLSLAELDKAVVELWPEFNNKPAIMRAYKAADRNGTGFISRKEFRLFLRYLVAYTNIFNIFTAMDTSQDRRLSEEEFVTNGGCVEEFKDMNDDQRRATFRRIDANGGGVLLFDEFAAAIADAEIRKVERVDDAQVEQQVIVKCPYCCRVRPATHMNTCREDVVKAAAGLPVCLRRPIPPAPNVSEINDIDHFNAWSTRAHTALLAFFRCPECPRHFSVPQARAFTEHFLSHCTTVARETRIKQLQRLDPGALTYAQQKPAAVAEVSNVVQKQPLPDVLRLDALFDKNGMARIPVTVRALSEILGPKATEAQMKRLAKCDTWQAAWALLHPVSNACMAASLEQAQRVLLMIEAAPARVDGLFDVSKLGGMGAWFIGQLRTRKNPKALARLVQLARTQFDSDADFLSFLRIQT